MAAQKTALVTGGSRGIGAACAKALASDGYKVFVGCNKSRAEAGRVASMCGGAVVEADVSDSGAVSRMLEETGEIDALVCCAGVAHYGLLADVSESEWRRVFDVNVGGVISCCRGVIPGMVRRKSGRIITLSSVWGICGASCEAVYSASKAAVIGLTKSLARELAPSGILVNCVAPGAVETDMLAPLAAEDITALRGEIPLGRLGTPEEIGALVRFLCSDAASYITGQVISPNGGFLV